MADVAVLLAAVRLGGGALRSWGVLGAIGCVVLLVAAGHYRCRITLGRGRDFGSIVACAVGPFLALALLARAETTKGGLVEL
ncbi:MAG TPA: hypothetical protein VK386_01955, partial [Acidimicrobiales bacterium]|nr:hypothetical protein [Acidimicrobiales bacterium]